MAFSTVLLTVSAEPTFAQEKVGWAGFAFRSFSKDPSAQFALTSKLRLDVQTELMHRLDQFAPEHFVLERGALMDWRKGQSISLACVLEFEQAFVTPIFDMAAGSTFYLEGVVLSGQTMFLDYSAEKVIASVPFTCAITNTFARQDAYDLERMTKKVLMDGNNGFLAEFLRAAKVVQPNRKTGGAVMVRPVKMCESARRALGIQTSEQLDRWGIFFANRLGCSLAHAHGVAVMPSVDDAVTRQIKLRFADSSEITLHLDTAAWTLDAEVDGIARYYDPKQSNAVRDVVIYGSRGTLKAEGVGGPLTENWQGIWGRAFVKGHQYSAGEAYYYRAVIENALVDLVETELLSKGSKSRITFEEIIRKCRL